MIFLRLFSGFIIQTLPFAVLTLYPFKEQLRYTIKKTVIMTTIIVLLLSALFSACGCYLNSIMGGGPAQFKTIDMIFMLCLIPCFMWVLYISKAQWQKKLFVYSFALTSALIITSICNVILSLVDESPYDGLPYSGMSSPVIFSVNVITIPLLVLLLRKGYVSVSSGLTKTEDGYLAILSIVIFMIMAGSFAFIDYSRILGSVAFFIWIMQLAMIFLIYSFFFKLMSLSHERMMAQQNSLNLQHQLEILNEQHLRFNESIENSRRMRHDLKHHMLTIRGLIKSGDVEKATAYTDEYIKVSEEYGIPKLCDVQVINWILNYYQMLAKEKNIEFTMRISTPPLKQIEIKDSDLSVLLGNLLENALNGASTVLNKSYVNLNIIYSGKMLVITVDNSFNGIVKTEDVDGSRRYRSTKDNHIGVGLASIESIAEKYMGGVEFTNTESEFHSSVMLNINTGMSD